MTPRATPLRPRLPPRARRSPARVAAAIVLLTVLAGCAARDRAGLVLANRAGVPLEVALLNIVSRAEIARVTLAPEQRAELTWSWGIQLPAPPHADGAAALRPFILRATPADGGEPLWERTFDAEPWLDLATGRIVARPPRTSATADRFVRARAEGGLYPILLTREGPLWLFDPPAAAPVVLDAAAVERFRTGRTDF